MCCGAMFECGREDGGVGGGGGAGRDGVKFLGEGTLGEGGGV